jgi:hypothetical protein
MPASSPIDSTKCHIFYVCDIPNDDGLDEGERKTAHEFMDFASSFSDQRVPNPTITFLDGPSAAIECFYDFGDGHI